MTFTPIPFVLPLYTTGKRKATRWPSVAPGPSLSKTSLYTLVPTGSILAHSYTVAGSRSLDRMLLKSAAHQSDGDDAAERKVSQGAESFKHARRRDLLYFSFTNTITRIAGAPIDHSVHPESGCDGA